SLGLAEVLVQQEGEPDSGDQELALDDLEGAALAQDVIIVEVRAFLQVVEGDLDSDLMRFGAPGEPGPAAGVADLGPALIGRDVAEQLPGHALRIAAGGELLDQAVLPYLIEAEFGVLLRPFVAGLQAAIADMKQAAAAQPAIHMEWLMEIA